MFDQFAASNGEEQGTVQSTALFCIYLDCLSTKLKRSGYGCYIILYTFPYHPSGRMAQLFRASAQCFYPSSILGQGKIMID